MVRYTEPALEVRGSALCPCPHRAASPATNATAARDSERDPQRQLVPMARRSVATPRRTCAMKIVSVMTSESHGGAEFAAVDMLEALVERGHDAVMLTNQPEMELGRNLCARAIELGPKLSKSSYPWLMARWPWLVSALRRALEKEWPYDVLLLHYKKEQLLASFLPRRLRTLLSWAEWGPLPYQLRTGPPRRAYLAAACSVDVVMAVSEGTPFSLRGRHSDWSRSHRSKCAAGRGAAI